MQLSKYYEDKHSTTRKVADLVKRELSLKNVDLHQIFRERKEDFSIENGVYKEKSVLMRKSVIHCKKI